MSTDKNQPQEQGLGVVALLNGIFLLFVLLLFAGATAGVTSVELVGWLLLLAGWVTFWTVKRRR